MIKVINCNHLDAINQNIDGAMSNHINPRLLVASIADKNTMHYGDAMKAHDHQNFRKSNGKGGRRSHQDTHLEDNQEVRNAKRSYTHLLNLEFLKENGTRLENQ